MKYEVLIEPRPFTAYVEAESADDAITLAVAEYDASDRLAGATFQAREVESDV